MASSDVQLGLMTDLHMRKVPVLVGLEDRMPLIISRAIAAHVLGLDSGFCLELLADIIDLSLIDHQKAHTHFVSASVDYSEIGRWIGLLGRGVEALRNRPRTRQK